MIQSYIKDQRAWDLNLGCLAGAYRTTIHESTGFSPNMLMLGRDVYMPGDVMNPCNHDVLAYVDYVEKLRARLQTSHELARQQLKQKTCTRKYRYDGNQPFHVY